MMLLATVALSFVACEDPQTEPKPKPKPEPEQPTELTFEVEVGEVTHSSVAYKVTPSDLEADYLVVLYDVESADDFTKDEYLVATLLQELEADARSKGMTLKEYMPEIVDKGVLESKYERLAPESEYYIIVFGVDAAKDYELCSAVSKTKVTTLAAPKIDISFEINTTVDGNSAEYEVIPSDTAAIWYFYTLPKESYDYYTSPEGYDMDDAEFILYCLQMQIESLRGAGYADIDIINAIFHKGTLTLMAKDLNANTEYINLIAAFDITEEGAVTLISDVTTSTYTTGDAAKKELTFEISVTNIESKKASILITPSNNTDTFCWLCQEWDGVSTAEEVMNSTVEMYGAWMSMMANYTGVQDYTGGPNSPYKYSLSAADTDYFVIAFGYAGGVTTDPVMVTFRTLPAADPATTEFSMTASNVTPYSFTAEITASHDSTYYYAEICSPGDYDEEALVKAVNESIASIVRDSQAFDPNTTIAMVLDQYYYNGNASVVAKGITPETEVMGFVYAIDSKTGEVCKTHTFNPLAKTSAVGSVTPTVELVGYYSGREENGTIFGDAAYTAESAITVVKYTNIDSARSLFATMLGGVLDNQSNYPDHALWGEAFDYWRSVTIAQPYSFYLAEWDLEQTALAYAVDQNGVVGGIGRLYTMPTAENKSNIEELRTLVNELNEASKSFVLPESLVIGENSRMMLTDFVFENTSEAVSVAEVKAEMPALNNNRVFVGGGYIRPFYL